MKDWIKKWYRIVIIVIIAAGLCCVLYCFWNEGTKLEILKTGLSFIVTALCINNGFLMIKIRREKKSLLKEIDNEIKLSIKHINCSSCGFNLIKKRSHIKKCDIYITDDALILFTNKTRPIILTQNNMFYLLKYNFAEIYVIYDIIFNEANSYVIIQLGFSKEGKTITLKALTDTEKKAIQIFAQNNKTYYSGEIAIRNS